MPAEWRIKLYRGVYAAVRANGRGGTERRSLGTRDKAAAQRALEDLLRPVEASTVSDLVAVYLADKDKTAIRSADLHNSWKNAKDHFGHLRPDQITRQVCRDYVQRRTRLGRKPATIRKEMEMVRAAVNFSKRGSQSVFELPPAPAHRERFLMKDEARLLVKAARRFPHVRAFIVLALCTGARTSALLELTWDRVDLDGRRINLLMGDHLDDQRKKRARVPINRRAYRYLRVMRANATCDHVIEWAGRPVASIKKGFAAAVNRAGLDDVTPHVLRHTAASWMAMAGVPMGEISKMLGHSNQQVTERVYAHIHPDFLQRAVNVLDF